ncbi:MAG: hypothetical protein VW739_05745 [Pelagibacteraceae bacterium]
MTSLAGLANLLRSNQPMTRRAVASVMLNSGLFGVAIAAWMFHSFGSEKFMLILAASILSGLGGNALVDFAIESVKSAIRAKVKDGSSE